MTVATPPKTTWESLQEVFEIVSLRGPDPIILSSIPYLPSDGHRHTKFPVVLGPPGRVISVAVGLRAALPDTPLLLVTAADSATLGTNHLIHTARRNIGMTLLVLRSDLLEAGDIPVDRTGWASTGYQVTMEQAGTPLEWAIALQASLVGRGSLLNPSELANLIVEAVETPGFSVIGVTGDPTLRTGVMSRRSDWPEYFTTYRAWSEGMVELPTSSIWPVTPAQPRSSAPTRLEVRIAGIGGQGVKLAGTVLSEAAGLGEGLWATQFGDYGSATRGGPSRVDVVMGSKRISYPAADDADILIVLSRDAAAAQLPRARPAAACVADEGTVDPGPGGPLVVPIAQLAREHTGTTIAAGVTSLGCVAALSDAVSLDSLRIALRARLPERKVETNLRAMEAAYELTTVLTGGKQT